MALSQSQRQLIIQLDQTAKQILQHGNQEALLMSLCGKMEPIKALMDSASQSELNDCCQRYPGFYQYMQLLEQMALACSRGAFDDLG